MYLNGLGISSYYPPIEVRPSKPVIHLPVGDEIAELFIEIDRYTPGKGSVDVRRMSNEYPVLFRLIYLNGLRASEARLLSMDDVDLYDGTIVILDCYSAFYKWLNSTLFLQNNQSPDTK